jgi:hypothetical protein
MGTNNFSKVILVATHSGKRPIGTFTEEVASPECEEVERSMAWIKAGPRQKEMIFRIKYTCGKCKGVLYTGITKEVDED